MWQNSSAFLSHSPNVSSILISSSPDMTDFIRVLTGKVIVNVFKSGAVIWLAAIFRTPSSMFDKLLHLSKSQGFAMSCSRSCNLCEALGNLLTVTMYLSRIVACPRGEYVDWHPLNPNSTIVTCEHLHNLLHWFSLRFPCKLHQPVPSVRIHQNSDKPCWKTRNTEYHVFSTEPLTQTAIK